MMTTLCMIVRVMSMMIYTGLEGHDAILIVQSHCTRTIYLVSKFHAYWFNCMISFVCSSQVEDSQEIHDCLQCLSHDCAQYKHTGSLENREHKLVRLFQIKCLIFLSTIDVKTVFEQTRIITNNNLLISCSPSIFIFQTSCYCWRFYVFFYRFN